MYVSVLAFVHPYFLHLISLNRVKQAAAAFMKKGGGTSEAHFDLIEVHI